MEALGGQYGVMKRRDGLQGSIFWFEIPYRPDTDSSRNLIRSPGGSLDPYDVTPPPQRQTSKKSDKQQQKSDKQQTQKSATPQSPTAGVSSSPSTKISTRTPKSISVSPSAAGTSGGGPIAAPTAPASTTVTPPPSTKEGVLNILVVDDAPSILKMSSKMLEKQGHRITTAENGAEALETMLNNKSQPRECAFSVVLMDLQMPVMDGLESTKRLRKFEAESGPESGHTLIIGVSANSDEETVKEAFVAGVDAFIPKPFNFQLFNEVYQSLVRQQQQQQQQQAQQVLQDIS